MAESLAVLIIDDNEADVERMLDALREGGYAPWHRRVDGAADLQRALDDPRWQLVMSAWKLPAVDGMQVFALMRERGLDLPFIIIGSEEDEEATVQALRAGVNDFVDRARLRRLVSVVAHALAEAASRRQRRLVEAELQHRRRQGEQSERLLRLIIESVPDAVAVIDNRGEFLLWNQTAEPVVRTLLGDPGDAGGIRPGFFLTDRSTRFDGLAERLQQVARGDPLERLELLLRHQAHPEGCYFSISARPLRDASGSAHGAVAVFHDTTAQRSAQEHLMISDRLASLGMLAAGIAHEINNPLAAVMANIALAHGEIGRLPEGASQQALTTLLDDAHDAAERVRQIVRDLRVFSREEEPRAVPVDVNKVMDASIRMARHHFRDRAALITDYTPEAFVRGSDSRLGQVFLNLLVNAVQAIPEGDPEGNRIEVRTCLVESGDVAIEVSDSGSGMSEEVREQLFKPFFTTKAAGLGTGLGLAICQRIVQALGGSIEVDSELGRGSTFRVLLQRVEPPAMPDLQAPLAPRAGHSDPGDARRGHVLVIDDEPLIGSAVGAILGVAHDVVSATEAEQALALLDAGERFDVILCDLLMPGMGGAALHAELQRRYPEQADRMLFLTGGAVTESSRDFLAGLPGRVVEKPFEPAGLLSAVQEFVQ
jgi:signal transduction histidine kinase